MGTVLVVWKSKERQRRSIFKSAQKICRFAEHIPKDIYEHPSSKKTPKGEQKWPRAMFTHP